MKLDFENIDLSDYELVSDGYGNYSIFKIDGAWVGWAFALGFLVIAGFLMATFMDKVYENGSLITTIFAIFSVLFLLEKITKKTNGTTIIGQIHGKIVAPSFVLYIYAGLTYWTTWADDISNSSSFMDDILFLLYIFCSPIVAFIVGPILTMLISIVAKVITGKKHSI